MLKNHSRAFFYFRLWKHNIKTPHTSLFVCVDALSPAVNNCSVMSGRFLVFLGWTSTEQRITCLAHKDASHTKQCLRWVLHQQPFDLKSNKCSTTERPRSSQPIQDHRLVYCRPLVKSAYQKIIFLFLNQNVCCGWAPTTYFKTDG